MPPPLRTVELPGSVADVVEDCLTGVIEEDLLLLDRTTHLRLQAKHPARAGGDLPEKNKCGGGGGEGD